MRFRCQKPFGALSIYIYLIENMIAYCIYNFLSAGNPPAPRQDGKIEWCTVGHAEQQKCDNLQIPSLECRRASSVEECIKKIMVLLGHMDTLVLIIFMRCPPVG